MSRGPESGLVTVHENFNILPLFFVFKGPRNSAGGVQQSSPKIKGKILGSPTVAELMDGRLVRSHRFMTHLDYEVLNSGDEMVFMTPEALRMIICGY